MTLAKAFVTGVITKAPEKRFVAVEGKLQINSFKLPNGNDKRVYEINANNIEKISASQNPMPQNQDANSDNIVSFEPDDTVAQDLIDEDEIPF